MGDDPVTWREVYVEPGSGAGLLSRLVTLGVVAAVVLPFLAIVADTAFSLTSWSNRPAQWGRYRSPLEEFQDRTKVWVAGVTCVLGSLLLLRAAVRGASALAGEKDRDTWVSLLSTPLTCREILRAKWWGCVWGQRHALALLGAVWAVGVVTGSVNPLFLALDAGVFAVYLAAFASIGLRCSATARSSRVAIARAAPVALFVGGGFWLPLACCGAFLSRGGGEVLGDATAFIASCTPPFLLTGLSAMDFALLRDMTRGAEGTRAFSSLTCGAVLGTVGWAVAAVELFRAVLAAFTAEANRQSPDE